jgi:hypothetical protein
VARLLHRLADCLAPQGALSCPRPASADQAPRVLAIDMDLAPLPGDSKAVRDAMVAALDALRRHVHVVTIVLDRVDDEARSRRNEFMKASRWTAKRATALRGFTSPRQGCSCVRSRDRCNT